MNDLFLSGYIQGKPADYNYESQEDLLNAINESFHGVDQEVLRSVFEPWVNRLKRAIKHEGKYLTKSRKNNRSFCATGRANRKMQTYGTRYQYHQSVALLWYPELFRNKQDDGPECAPTKTLSRLMVPISGDSSLT
jgi:hypothetical protein